MLQQSESRRPISQPTAKIYDRNRSEKLVGHHEFGHICLGPVNFLVEHL